MKQNKSDLFWNDIEEILYYCSDDQCIEIYNHIPDKTKILRAITPMDWLLSIYQTIGLNNFLETLEKIEGYIWIPGKEVKINVQSAKRIRKIAKTINLIT